MSPNWVFMQSTTIRDSKTGEPYIKRLRIVKTPWFGMMLHRIYREDWARDPHDHPWNFTSVILCGGYEEEVYTLKVDGESIMAGEHWHWQRREHDRWGVNRINRGMFHRINEVFRIPTWTLVFTGVDRRSWGFLTREGRIPLDQYEDLGVAS